MLLQGDKVRLRPVTDADLREMYSLFNDPAAWGEFEDFRPVDWFTFEKEARERGQSPDKRLGFLIEPKGESEFVGFIFYSLREHALSNYEIGYAILRPEARRKGYASQAVRLIVDYLFSTRNIERVEAATDVANLGSQRVLERAGFRREGTLRKARYVNAVFRDYHVYGLLREEWKPLT